MDISNRSCEPMDIDLSTNSGNQSAMDISNTDAEEKNKHNLSLPTPDTTKNSPNPTDRPNYRVLNIKMKNRRNKNTMKTTSSVKLKIVISTIFVLLAVLVYNFVNFKCCDELDVNDIMKSLTKNVYGQEAAIEDISTALGSNDRSKIIFFYGGTGVGKTLSVSIIFESLWHHPNVYHYTMPNFAHAFSTDFLVGLALCDKSYFVLENLSGNDVDVKNHIKDIIAKSEDLGKYITVMLVYNCDTTSNGFLKKCDQSFKNKLKDNFSELSAAKYFVNFQPLLGVHLRMCIKKELGEKRVSAIEMNRFIKSFDVSLDGCKGVHMKMKLLNAA